MPNAIHSDKGIKMPSCVAGFTFSVNFRCNGHLPDRNTVYIQFISYVLRCPDPIGCAKKPIRNFFSQSVSSNHKAAVKTYYNFQSWLHCRWRQPFYSHKKSLVSVKIVKS